MHALVRQVFHRLHSLDPVHEEEKLRDRDEEKRENEIKVDMQISSNSNSTSVDTGSSQTAVADDEKLSVPDKVADINRKEDVIVPLNSSTSTTPTREECALLSFKACY